MFSFRHLASLVVVATFAGATPAFAAEHDSGHDAAVPAGAAQAALSEGSVKKLDKAAGKITISHGPLVNLGMPAMTMVFRAADPSMLDGVEPGDKIRFNAARVDGAFIVTTMEAAK